MFCLKDRSDNRDVNLSQAIVAMVAMKNVREYFEYSFGLCRLWHFYWPVPMVAIIWKVIVIRIAHNVFWSDRNARMEISLNRDMFQIKAEAEILVWNKKPIAMSLFEKKKSIPTSSYKGWFSYSRAFADQKIATTSKTF